MHAPQPTIDVTQPTPVIDLTTDTITWLTCAAEALGWTHHTTDLDCVNRTLVTLHHDDHGRIDIVFHADCYRRPVGMVARWVWNEPEPNPTTHLTVDLCRWLRGEQ